VFMDDRWLYRDEAVVPEKIYEVAIGKAAVRRKGKDLTIVACSYLAREAVKAAAELKKNGIDTEVIDLRTVKPLDTATILRSVRKTGRLLIADGGWRSFGVSAEIAAIVAESGVKLKKPLVRLTLPDCPAPASVSLEKAYFIHCADLLGAAMRLVKRLS
ncbi:MAG: transketolase C-terminal domain-containing protein, partial [Minisyncoccota bacterium]